MVLQSRLSLVVACLALAVGFSAGTVRAEDKNATGTWKYSVTFNDQTRETTMKLKQDGDKITGTVTGRDGTESPIDEGGTIKDGQLAFGVTREREGQKFTIKYTGKLDGDSIKGQMEVNFGGQARMIDFEAKRQS